MDEKFMNILKIGCSGLVGVILTIGYQHFFSKSVQSITVIIDGKEAIVTEKDYSELYKQKTNLENQLFNNTQELDETKDKLNQTENELKTLSKDVTNYEYYDMKINIDGVDKNNFVKGFLDIDGREFISFDSLNEIISEDINYEDNTLYIGHSTAEKVKLLEVCPPYDVSDGYSTEPFKMNGDLYDGFSMNLNGTKYVLVNLKQQYSNLEFDFGHIDGAYNYNCILNIYLDEKLVQSIEKRPDSMVSHIDIPLNYAKQLKIEFDYGYSVGEYGLGNIYLQY